MDIADVIAAYDRSAEEYAKSQRSKTPERELARFFELLKPNSKILDAGCGSGRDSHGIKDHGFDVVGTDLSEKLLAIAKKDNPDIEFLLADIRSIPKDDASFDAIWSNAVLHHLDREQMPAAIAEFNRLLALGGLLCIRTKLGKGNLQTREASVNGEERQFTLLSTDELDDMLRQGGFTKIELNTSESRSRPGLFWLTALYRKS